jgi:hypothetical protein
MDKNLSKNQILLIIIATVLLLLAAFSFYLLQDPTAPLPFVPPPPTGTFTPLPATPTDTPTPSATPIPTRRTSYTPFASPDRTDIGTLPEETITPVTLIPESSGTTTISPISSTTITPGFPTNTSTLRPLVTTSVSPTASQTLIAGQYEVAGLLVQNGTPIANVVVEFTDDDPPRKRTTNSNGHYSFITLAPGTTFSLAFNQADNPHLTPVPEIASLAWIEGTLPTGDTNIELPDLEVSINIDGMIFRLVTPVDGATFSAAVISPSNPIQFTWTLYNQGNTYFIELGPDGSDEPVWISGDTTSTSLMWNGILNDGSHISAGAYWWHVGVNKTLGNYELIAFTNEWDLIFNP